MNGAKNIQPTDYAIDETSRGYCTGVGNANGTGCSAKTHESGMDDIHQKRLQQYATHLELLMLRKNLEISDLQRIMESRVEEMRSKQVEHERVMIHQARHAAMGEMLGTIAHQWRQPLHSISLVVQNMKDAWEYGEFNGELLERSIFQAMEQIMYLSRTIDDFRTYLNPVKMTNYIRPQQCIEESVGLLSSWFSNFPAIELQKSDGAEELILIAGCQNAFKQVLLNLLNNASDAVQEQQRRIGSVFRGVITIQLRSCGNDVVITVTDNGGGIDESVMKHIFEPYFTTKPKANGIGIGLYVARLIVENSLNGTLWAENIPGGAQFGIRLPVSADGG